MENNQNEEVELDWDDHEEKSRLSEGIKKVMATGFSALMMSEEALKQYLQDVKLPKDALGNIIKGVSNSKEEIVGRVGDELSKLIQKVDVVDELTKFMRENKIKCSMEIEFSKKASNTPEENDS